MSATGAGCGPGWPPSPSCWLVPRLDVPRREPGVLDPADRGRVLQPGGRPQRRRRHRITVDGRQPTNGFQPLFTAAEAACYRLAGGDAVLALRLVTALSGDLCRDRLAGRRDRRRCRRRRWSGAADPTLARDLLYGGGFLSFMHHFNGLETGLVVLLYALAWRAYQLVVRAKRRAARLRGLSGYWCWRGSMRRCSSRCSRPGSSRRAGATTGSGRCGAPARPPRLPSRVVALVAYNYFEFGSLMPTSGTAQQPGVFWSARALGVLGAWRLEPATLWLGRFDEAFHDGILPSALRAIVIGALLIAIVRAWRTQPPTAGSGEAACSAPRRRVRRRARRRRRRARAVLRAELHRYWFYYRYLFPVR